MASFLNRLTRKKEKSARLQVSAEAALKPEPAIRPAVEKKSERHMVGISLIPHVTEKTTRGAQQGWYTFRVPDAAGKIIVKNAVEDRYRVHVTRVRIVPVLPRKVRIGRMMGYVPGFKKASVKLKGGESIELT